MERVVIDNDFLSRELLKVKIFYRCGILPELLAKYYTRQTAQCVPKNKTGRPTWCFCKREEEEGREMIGCDNSNCIIQWFHTECLWITKVPKGEWLCPECRKNRSAEKKK